MICQATSGMVAKTFHIIFFAIHEANRALGFCPFFSLNILAKVSVDLASQPICQTVSWIEYDSTFFYDIS